MKTLKTLTIVTVTAVVAMTGAYAQSSDNAQVAEIVAHQKGAHSKHGKGHMRALFKQLNLTEAQKEEMKALGAEMKANRKAMRSAKLQHNITDYVSASGFDKQGFVDMATQRSAEKTEQRATMFEKRMNILTPEQRTQFVQLMQEKMKAK